jgi:predicted nucleic acid-binding protein
VTFRIDTVSLSALRKRQRNPNIVAWFERQRTADLFLSVISIGEIERGIARQRATDPEFARALAAWLDRVLTVYGERIVPFDLRAARRWGALSAALGNDSADLMCRIFRRPGRWSIRLAGRSKGAAEQKTGTAKDYVKMPGHRLRSPVLRLLIRPTGYPYFRASLRPAGLPHPLNGHMNHPSTDTASNASSAEPSMSIDLSGAASIVSKIRGPSSLAGVAILALYAIYDRILSLGIFPELSEPSTAYLLTRIVDTLFWLALLAILLGATSHLASLILRHISTKQGDMKLVDHYVLGHTHDEMSRDKPNELEGKKEK